ncbi:phosphotransferase [Catellatospora tritici]|uniref:phosphotransferase n=1 Tax=Catellatospora tritici TaxID=2851566 RepID=UPI001C2D6CAC|nr:phosphotransferase [Catellatospora tritici]MBV1850107.1 phosphotransferase [Catellatospora tritici]
MTSDPPPAEVCRAFGLPAPRSSIRLAHGLMNRNWRIATDDSREYAVKELRDVSPAHARTQHALLGRLAEHGIPVVLPVADAAGETVAQVAGVGFTVTPWVDGEHLAGARLDVAACDRLGRLLGRVQTALAAVRPDVPASAPADPSSRVAAAGRIERYLAAIAARPVPDPVDRVAADHLRWRRALLATAVRPVGERPEQDWTHGDFHQFNLVWRAGAVVAVLDWDRVRRQPPGAELIRACLLHFAGEDGTLDLDRIAAVVRGYRAIRPVDGEVLANLVQLAWWQWFTNFWPLDRRYDHGDTSCDHQFVANERTLRWWTAHRPQVCAALSGVPE